MTLSVREFCKGFEKGVDKVRALSKDFCEPLGITVFGYVRVYRNGRVSWLTSKPEQDCLIIDSGLLNEEPLLNTPKALQEGHYLWFNDRQFPGSDSFYRDRARLYHLDHGMVIVRHQKDYLETCCFSGLLARRALYNHFMNERALFSSFMDHFINKLDPRLLTLLHEGVTLRDLKSSFGKPSVELLNPDSKSLVDSCGWKTLLQLSKRERECLVHFKQGLTYQKIGEKLKLSHRTVEHYMDSVKNKLGLETRSELYQAAEKLHHFSLT